MKNLKNNISFVSLRLNLGSELFELKITRKLLDQWEGRDQHIVKNNLI